MGFPSFNVMPCWRLALFLALLHLGAFFCVLFSALLPAIQVSMMLLLSFHLGVCLCLHAFRSFPHAIQVIWQDANGIWHLQAKNGKVVQANLQKDSVLMPMFWILRFKRLESSVKKVHVWRSLIVFPMSLLFSPHSMSPVVWHRLKVYLLLKGYEKNS